MSNNISMFPHVGSGNHGCEAIVRSTAELFGKDSLILFSDNIEEDKKYMGEAFLTSLSATKEITTLSSSYLKAQYYKRIKKMDDAFEYITYSPILSKCSKGDILMSTGGDLYCYETPEYIYTVNRYVRARGCKTVLWGCSIEPSYIDEKMKADLSGYDLICARESITYEAVKAINPNTILTVDPAFVLPKRECKLPAKSYIGINLSPMAQKLETVEGMAMENYKRLIEHILDTCDDSVALIPHVVWKSNDDRDCLFALKEMFKDNDRVVVVDDNSCIDQKYIISNCRIFVGARTHATIAAYSSCVPTLVVGYSIKAKGIAKDLFGTYDNYVLPVQELKKPDNLSKAFDWMLENEMKIKDHLTELMPEYIGRLEPAVKAVRALQGEN